MQGQQKKSIDDSPIARLYQQYGSVILTSIRSHLPSREDAEDVLLEVFLAALENDHLLKRSEGEQLAWLRRVAHNKMVDHLRRTKRRPAVALEKAADILYDDEYQAPEQVALRQEAHARLHSHLATLPEQQQEVLRLRFADDLRGSEIARRLNKSESAIYMSLSRSLNFLRGIYKRQEREYDG